MTHGGRIACNSATAKKSGDLVGRVLPGDHAFLPSAPLPPPVTGMVTSIQLASLFLLLIGIALAFSDIRLSGWVVSWTSLCPNEEDWFALAASPGDGVQTTVQYDPTRTSPCSR